MKTMFPHQTVVKIVNKHHGLVMVITKSSLWHSEYYQYFTCRFKLLQTIKLKTFRQRKCFGNKFRIAAPHSLAIIIK